MSQNCGRKEGRTGMQQKHFMVTVSIVAMWLAVLFIGVYGGDLRVESESIGMTTDTVEIPIASAVALFAIIASAPVGWRGFRD